MSKELLNELAAKHGNVAAFKAPDGRIIALAKPDNVGIHFARLQTAAQDTNRQATEIKTYVLAFVVHPSKADAKAILDEWPAMLPKLALKANALAGADCEEIELGKD